MLLKTQNSKEEVKKELINSIIEGKKHGNKDIDEKADKVEKMRRRGGRFSRIRRNYSY